MSAENIVHKRKRLLGMGIYCTSVIFKKRCEEAFRGDFAPEMNIRKQKKMGEIVVPLVNEFIEAMMKFDPNFGKYLKNNESLANEVFYSVFINKKNDMEDAIGKKDFRKIGDVFLAYWKQGLIKHQPEKPLREVSQRSLNDFAEESGVNHVESGKGI